MYKRSDRMREQSTNIVKFLLSFHSLVTFSFPPIHDGINQRLWLLPIDVCKSRDQLIEIWINPCPADLFQIFWFLCCSKDALIDLVISLHNELQLSLVRGHLNELFADLIEEVMKCVFPHRLLLLAMS